MGLRSEVVGDGVEVEMLQASVRVVAFSALAE